MRQAILLLALGFFLLAGMVYYFSTVACLLPAQEIMVWET